MKGVTSKKISRNERKNPYLNLNWAEIASEGSGAFVMPESPSRRAFVLLCEAANKFGYEIAELPEGLFIK